MNIHVPSLVKTLKSSFFLGIKDMKSVTPDGIANAACCFATNDLIRSNKEFERLDLSRVNLIYMLFPKKIFNSIRSPQYLPYQFIAKGIMDGITKFSDKEIIQTLYGLSSVKYFNMDTCKLVFEHLEKKID